MTVYIAAALVFLSYCFAIPVKFALSLHISAHSGFGTGISIFEGRYALKRARLRSLGLKKHLPWKKAELDLKKNAALTAALKASRHLLKHMQVESLRAYGHISFPDAAQTALVCGCARSLEAILISHTQPGTVQIKLDPDFSSGQSNVFLCGMVSVQTGHIMLAALIGAWNYITRSKSHGKASD